MTIVNSKYRGTKAYTLTYSRLIKAAKEHSTVSYKEIVNMTGLPSVGNQMSRALGLLLGAISEDEVEKGRPMLSALAVNFKGVISPYFFKYARDIGKLTDQDEAVFWENEKKAVYETWKVN
jgi:hypothetical protein